MSNRGECHRFMFVSCGRSACCLAGRACSVESRCESIIVRSLFRQARLFDTEMSKNVVYAIVKAGGRQEKVSVGSVVVVDKIDGNEGDKVELEPIMLVDGDKVTTAADGISAKVTAEIVRAEKGPKISIIKYKNKTGYRKRQGHREQLTRLKVTGIK